MIHQTAKRRDRSISIAGNQSTEKQTDRPKKPVNTVPVTLYQLRNHVCTAENSPATIYDIPFGQCQIFAKIVAIEQSSSRILVKLTDGSETIEAIILKGAELNQWVGEVDLSIGKYMKLCITVKEVANHQKVVYYCVFGCEATDFNYFQYHMATAFQFYLETNRPC